MAKAHKEQKECNLLKPLNIEELVVSSNDCFGKEWSPEDRECSLCADQALCGTVFNQTVLEPLRNLRESEMGPFLDQVQPLSDKVLKKLEKKIEKLCLEGNPISVEELVEYFMTSMKTKDKYLAIMEIKKFMGQSSRIYKEGKYILYK